MTEQGGSALPTLPALPTPTGSPLAPPAAIPLVAPVTDGAPASVAPLPIPTLPAVTERVKPSVADPLSDPGSAANVPHAVAPTGTPTPAWKKRKKSPIRKMVKVVATLGVLGGLGYGGFLGYQKLAPESAPASLPLDDPDTLIGRSNQLTDEINENVEEAIILDELGLDPLGEPDSIQSYDFVWSSPTNVSFRVSSDVATGNYQLTDGTQTIRRVGQEVFSQPSPASAWILVAPSAAVPPAVLAGPLELSDVIPDVLAPWVVGPTDVPGGLVTYSINEPAMFAEAPEVWTAYMTSWGYDPNVAAGMPNQDMMVTTQVDPSGQLVMISLDSRSLGGVVTYTLMSMAGTPLVVEAPLAGS